MFRCLAAALGSALVLAPLALRAAEGDPCNPPRPTMIEGAKVKKGSCGPYMMKAAK